MLLCYNSIFSKNRGKLDQPATYQVRVPGELDKGWSDWSGGMQIAVESQRDGPPITALTGKVDQAALRGLLRRLYSLGLPLISAVCVECDS